MEGIAPFGISVCGIEELSGHCETGVSHVLSILDPEWPVPEAFGSFGEHAKLELRFHDVIEETPGQIAPRQEDAEAILAFGRDLMAEPAAVAETRPITVRAWPPPASRVEVASGPQPPPPLASSRPAKKPRTGTRRTSRRGTIRPLARTRIRTASTSR